MKQSAELNEAKNIAIGVSKMDKLFQYEIRKAYARGYVNGRVKALKEIKSETVSLENENIRLKNELLKKQLLK